jgi:LysM repeat protein
LPAIQPTVTTTASATNTPGVFRPLATATKSALRPFCQPPPSWHPHIVTETDTFASLSRTYARPVEELMQANCRTDENDLQAGERIFLPELPTSTPTVTPTVTPTPTRTVRRYVPPLQPTWTGGPYIITPYTSTPTPPPPPTSNPMPQPTATTGPQPTQLPTEISQEP